MWGAAFPIASGEERIGSRDMSFALAPHERCSSTTVPMPLDPVLAVSVWSTTASGAGTRAEGASGALYGWAPVQHGQWWRAAFIGLAQHVDWSR
jgi:hypothetical protein